MSFRMRINSENPNRKVSEPIPIPAPTEKPTPVNTCKPVIGQDERLVLNNGTNKYFTGSKQQTSSQTEQSESQEPAKNDTFTVVEDTAVYDQ